MLLHFIFVIKKEDYGKRNEEFQYVMHMSNFYKKWIKEKFSKDYDVKCDEMITGHRGLLERLDTNALLRDHRQRGEDTFHFYLSHFRPFWTDCTCEGYFAQNFAMIHWQKPKTLNDVMFLAEKNCTTVSHELSHELLRQAGYKKFKEDVHDVWTRHFYANLPFEQYGVNFEKTNDKPMFLTMDVSSFRL